MSRAKDRQKFLRENRYCCLCGGNVLATTIEHAPSRALFLCKDVKGAFRFPACARCNNGTSGQDQIAAMATLIMGAATASHVSEDYLARILRGVANNHPEAIRLFGLVASTDHLRINGLIREVHEVEVNRQLFRDWLEPWAAKQAISFWFKHTQKILPQEGGVFVHWIPNAHLEGHQDFMEKIARFDLRFGTVKQGKISYETQFSYKYTIEECQSFGMFLFTYHGSCLVWCGVFEDMEKALRFRELPLFRTGPEKGIEAFSNPTMILGSFDG